MPTTRLIRVDDAPALATLVTRNRDFFAPWEPQRDESYYTLDGQRAVIDALLSEYAHGFIVPRVIEEDGHLVGRITLNQIARGPFLSCRMGYLVDPAFNGRGIATAAVAQVLDLAFVHMGLHRVEAGTLVHNGASQKVLQRNGFTRFGLAPRYLKIAGSWQDHILFQRLADDD